MCSYKIILAVSLKKIYAFIPNEATEIEIGRNRDSSVLTKRIKKILIKLKVMLMIL